MACKQEPLHGVVTVGSRGNTTSVFSLVPGVVDTRKFTKLNPSYEVLSRTTNLEVQGHFQYSNDGVTWTDATNGLSWTSTTGWQYAGYTSLDSTYRYVRFGVRARTASGQSTIDVGVVRLIVEFQD